MADKPFDSTPIGFLEKPMSPDHNQNTSQIYQTIRELFRATVGVRSSNASPASKTIDGFINDGLRVVPSSPAAMSVQVTSGMGFLYTPADTPSDIGTPDIQGLDDLCNYKPVVLINPVTFPITAPTSGNSRIDIIEVKVDRRLENLTARRQFDSTSEAFVPHSYYKTLAYALDGRTGIVATPASSTAGLSYKTGTQSLTPSAPATTAGYVKIAEVRTASGTVTVTGSLISDLRKILQPGGVVRAELQFTLNWNAGTPTATITYMNAPPGVEIGIKPLGTRGYFELYALAAGFTGATCQIQCHPSQIVVGDMFMPVRTNLPNGNPNVQAVASGEQATLAACTPPLLVGQAQQRYGTQACALLVDGASVIHSDTVESENLAFSAHLSFAYH